MTRFVKKIGDVFSAKVSETSKKYFQYIAHDKANLGGDIIRAFDAEYPIDGQPDLTVVIADGIAFYAICILRVGIKLEFWEKVGNIPQVGKLDHILFRLSRDLGHPNVEISRRWSIWKAEDAAMQYVGELKGENRIAEDGMVMDPESIVHRMRTGKYRFLKPLRFE